MAAHQGHEDVARLLADKDDGAFINATTTVRFLLLPLLLLLLLFPSLAVLQHAAIHCHSTTSNLMLLAPCQQAEIHATCPAIACRTRKGAPR
jgi:hypothetical protein